LCSEHLNKYMATRPNKGTVVLGLNGYKFKYGYNPDKTGNPDIRPRVGNLKQLSGPDNIAEEIGKIAVPIIANELVIEDSFSDPQDGKSMLKPHMAALQQWLHLDWTQLQFKKISRNLKKYFVKAALPFDVDTLYVVYYLKMNTRDYPVFKGMTVSFAVPVKGPGRNWFELTRTQGDA